MTVNKADQDCVTPIIAALVERFGAKRIVVALHNVASKKTGALCANDYNKFVGALEGLEHEMDGLSLPALEGVAIKLVG